jgi:hypothetical protein
MAIKARVPNKSISVHATTDSAAPIVGELQPCDEFNLGARKKHANATWLSVTLPNGLTGYIPGDTEVCRIRNAHVNQDVRILAAPNPQARQKTVANRGANFRHAGLVARNGSQWIEVRTPSGKVGFMAPNAPVAFAQEAEGRLASSYAMIFFVGVFSLVLSLVGWLVKSDILPGWEGTVGGSLLLILGFFVKRRSSIALGLAVAIWSLELLARALAVLIAFVGTRGSFGGMFMPIFALYIGYMFWKTMWGGFAALADLKIPVQLLDWPDLDEHKPATQVPAEGNYGDRGERAHAQESQEMLAAYGDEPAKLAARVEEGFATPPSSADANAQAVSSALDNTHEAFLVGDGLPATDKALLQAVTRARSAGELKGLAMAYQHVSERLKEAAGGVEGALRSAHLLLAEHALNLATACIALPSRVLPQMASTLEQMTSTLEVPPGRLHCRALDTCKFYEAHQEEFELVVRRYHVEIWGEPAGD